MCVVGLMELNNLVPCQKSLNKLWHGYPKIRNVYDGDVNVTTCIFQLSSVYTR